MRVSECQTHAHSQTHSRTLTQRMQKEQKTYLGWLAAADAKGSYNTVTILSVCSPSVQNKRLRSQRLMSVVARVVEWTIKSVCAEKCSQNSVFHEYQSVNYFKKQHNSTFSLQCKLQRHHVAVGVDACKRGWQSHSRRIQSRSTACGLQEPAERDT